MDHSLDSRQSMPDALRVLLDEYPRAGWPRHRNFDGLVRFWLERHLMFRRLTEAMATDTEALLERRLDPRMHSARLARFGGIFVSELHGHHHIEDAHYFPVLAQAEPRIAAGFELLDADHKALDGILSRFADAANSAIRAEEGQRHRAAAGEFLTELRTTQRLLDRHLTDEEDLVVPVILRHGPAGLG
ncbi:MAG: hemerythrin domain-containing protein [Gemmobacter sp.]